jgi:altronate hydrolase
LSAPALLRLAPDDDVAVALRPLAPGAPLGPGFAGLALREAIPLGHKVALRPIEAGAPVRKCGVPIGRATRPIAPGEHVHVHNLASAVLVNALDHAEE